MDRRSRVIYISVGVAVLLCWVAVVAPLRGAVRRLQAEMPRHSADLAEMQRLHARYAQLRLDGQELERRVAARTPEFALFSFVTRVAQRQRLPLASLSPSARPISERWQVERVEVKLDNVSFPALAAFLHALSAPAYVVRIDRFDLRGGKGGLQVSFEVQTLTLRS